MNVAVAERLAAELARALPTKIILVHGTGAVGKPPAIAYGYLDTGSLPKERALVSCEVHDHIRSLNQKLVEVLLRAGIPAIGVAPAPLVSSDFQGLRNPGARTFLTELLRCGVLPVLYGDLIPASNGDFRVLSSDIIACVLAKELGADNLIFLSNVPGVYACAKDEGHGPILKEITAGDLQRPDLFGASDANDVSGGMRAKIELALAASRHCRACWVGSGREPDVLTRFFKDGIIVGTRIRGKP